MPKIDTNLPIIYPQRFTRQETITKDRAMEFLSKSRGNRPLDWGRIRQYAESQRTGCWPPHAHGFIVDMYGFTIDGHHRAQARLLHDVDFESDVSYGDDPNAMIYIDTNKPRTVSQNLGLFTDIPNPHYITPRAAIIKRLELPVSARNFSKRPDGKEVEIIFERYKQGLLWSLDALPGSSRKFGGAPVAGVLAYAYAHDPDHISLFTEAVLSGENLKKNEPAFMLREYIQNKSLSGEHERFMAQRATMRALLASIKGQPIKVFRTIEGDWLHEEFIERFPPAPLVLPPGAQIVLPRTRSVASH